MRALRVVGITEDNGELSVVLEDLSHRERYTVPADEQLRAAARGDLTRLGQIAIELESQLRPREIQARIRAGASVEQVASAAGVPVSKIERFAYPVLLERTRTADLAQRAHPVRADGPDSRMLGDVVAHTFGLRGQDYDGGEWDSWKGEDGRWVVALSWRAGRSDNRAHWTFQPGAHGGTVTAIDEHASDLVEGLQLRPLRTVGPVIDIARPEEQEPAPEERAQAAGRRTADGTDAPPPRTDQSRQPVEQRRPAPPAQRQPVATETAPPAPTSAPTSAPVPTEPAAVAEPEPVLAEVVAPVAAAGASTRAEQAPSTRADAARSETVRTDAGRTEPTRPETGRSEPVRREPARSEPARREPSRPEPSRPDSTRQDSTRPDSARSDSGRPEPARREPSRQEPARSQPARQESAQRETAARQEPAPAEPAKPAEPAASEAAPAAPAAPKPRTKKGKPVMPSWDEVLLGVRGQR